MKSAYCKVVVVHHATRRVSQWMCAPAGALATNRHTSRENWKAWGSQIICRSWFAHTKSSWKHFALERLARRFLGAAALASSVCVCECVCAFETAQHSTVAWFCVCCCCTLHIRNSQMKTTLCNHTWTRSGKSCHEHAHTYKHTHVCIIRVKKKIHELVQRRSHLWTCIS